MLVDDDFPAPRRYAVDLGDSGADTIRFGDQHPSLCGWVISWVTTLGTNGALPQCLFTCSDRWFEQKQLNFGDQTLSPSIGRGGRVFIPYPTIEMGLYDSGGIGNVNVQVIGRPIGIGQDPGARTTVLAWSTKQVSPSSSQTILFPEGAQRYWTVKTGEATSVGVQLEAGAAFNTVWDQYTLSLDDVTNGQLTPSPWRDLPPPDASSPGRIRYDNNDDTNTASMAAVFEFDFAAGR